MIIKKFQEQANICPGNIAIKTEDRTITYNELNIWANRVGAAIGAGGQKISLLFEHGPDMIAGVIAALKAGKIYIPMDVTYPENRLAYMLENSDSDLILTNSNNFSLAETLLKQTNHNICILNIDNIKSDEYTGDNIEREEQSDSPAYILYTSGSTGHPKGVIQTHRNVLYYTRNWIQRFSITGADRMTLFSAFSHDGSVQDMFGALLIGATLYPYNIKTGSTPEELYTLLKKEAITIWHSVPSLFRFFTTTLTVKDIFYDVRWVLLGGEPLRSYDLELFNEYFPKAILANVYGQTESSVGSICEISHADTFDSVTLGKPLDETTILLVGEDGDILETMGVGEIVIASDYIASGYWKDKENSERVFTRDEELGRLYWTGDLGRLSAQRTIKMMGRKDFQVKIRGFRVETGEIESVLLKNKAVKETAVVAYPDENGDYYLFAYLVCNETVTPGALRDYISTELPAYMIPRHFIILETMPTTPNGKIDRNRLPKPEELDILQLEYEAPTNEIEEKLAAIWQDVLGVEKIGINDNFIEVGGQSLAVISIIFKIHEELNVKLQLMDVFDNPTIKELSRLVMNSKESLFLSIEPTEEKEYYAVTPDQERMYFLNQMEGIGVTYNLYSIMKIEGYIDRDRFRETCRKLVKRHESLRTSFEMNDQNVIQRIHENLDFQVMYIDAGKENTGSESEIEKIISDFIKPFDLKKAPLLHVGLIHLQENIHLLVLDSHHIIMDGITWEIIIKEFVSLYNGNELPALELKYIDYSEWYSHIMNSSRGKEMEEYWIDRFKGDIPVLNLPTTYPRADVQSFEGDIVLFTLGKELAVRLNQMVKETGVTLYILLLAIYNILLHKYSGQEDIVVGSVVSGRNHSFLEKIVGYFSKTIAVRNYPIAAKTFRSFLEEVKNTVLSSIDNQLYPFSRLVEKLHIKRESGRNPLFDAAFLLQNYMTSIPKELSTEKEWKMTPYKKTKETTMFDLYFEAIEIEDDIACCFQYSTKLFERETIELMKRRFLSLVESILSNSDSEIRDINWKIDIENEMNKAQEVDFDF